MITATLWLTGRRIFHGWGIPKHVGEQDAANAGGRAVAKKSLALHVTQLDINSAFCASSDSA